MPAATSRAYSAACEAHRLWLVADAVWWGWVVVVCLSACLWIAGSEGGRRDGLLGVVSGQPCTLPVPGRVTACGCVTVWRRVTLTACGRVRQCGVRV